MEKGFLDKLPAREGSEGEGRCDGRYLWISGGRVNECSGSVCALATEGESFCLRLGLVILCVELMGLLVLLLEI